MAIGIDLDNTVICYDELFLSHARDLHLVGKDFRGGKRALRDYIKTLEGGEEAWRRLQGEVYGVGITRAKLFPGVFRFLWRCHRRGLSVDIVSHKTEYGHFDNTGVSLREAATTFLEDRGLLCVGQDSFLRSVKFFPSQKEKVTDINSHAYDWFIDDLPEILNHPLLIDGPKKIGFSPDGQAPFDSVIKCVSWLEIEGHILGEWSPDELAQLARAISPRPVIGGSWIGGRGNAGIAQVHHSGDEAKSVLKIYPYDSGHDRLNSEYRSFEILGDFGESNIPRCLGKDEALNVAMYSWMEGVSVTKVRDCHIQQFLDFLRRLASFHCKEEFLNFPPAAAAIFSGQQLDEQISKRLVLLREFSDDTRELHCFLDKEFAPAFEKILETSKDAWYCSDFSRPIPDEIKALSPSDYGVHNTIEGSDGQLRFYDFEYFGWDDPAKLACDFLFHPSMDLSKELQGCWIHGMGKIYDEGLADRVRSMWALIGLVWCLIFLNEFRSDLWARRLHARGFGQMNRSSIRSMQLIRAQKLLERVKLGYPNF